MSQTIKTGRQTGRRDLHFHGVDDALADIDAIVAADAAGTLKTLGNWTAGQTLAHVAAWIEYGYEGFPIKPPPFFIRWFLKKQVPKYLRKGLPAGVKIPGVPGGTVGADEMPTEAAAQRMRTALLRLKNGEPAKYPSPAFGDMSHEDRTQFNLRHAELHLSFLVPNS